MSWLSKTFHHIGHGFKNIFKGVGKAVKATLGIATGGMLYNGAEKVKESSGGTPNLVAAPEVAPPEPIVGTEEETLTGRRVKRNNRGKSSLYIGAGGGYTGSGGTTGTGLNL